MSANREPTDLDKARLHYSHKHHCLVSLTAPDAADPSEWHLPTYDPRNENKYHYKLHSLDVYFYTQSDALQFVNGIRRVLPPAQADVQDEPRPGDASAVVQKLEKVALSEPSAADQARDFTPMAYNPAAPAAPESIRPREKTPPPDDGGVNPLAAAMAYDQQPFSPGIPPPPPGGPGQPSVASPGLPPQALGSHPGLQRSSTMPVHGGLASPGLASPYGNSFQAPQGYTPQGHATPPTGAQGVPPPPSGAPAQYPYGQQQQRAPGGGGYAVHQQYYTPGPGEIAEEPQATGNTGRLERGVGGMFKKFEKRFG